MIDIIVIGNFLLKPCFLLENLSDKKGEIVQLNPYTKGCFVKGEVYFIFLFMIKSLNYFGQELANFLVNNMNFLF